MPYNTYVDRTGVSFEIPQAPGIQAPHPAGITAPQTIEANRLHDKAEADFKSYEEVSAQ